MRKCQDHKPQSPDTAVLKLMKGSLWHMQGDGLLDISGYGKRASTAFPPGSFHVTVAAGTAAAVHVMDHIIQTSCQEWKG